VVDAQKESETEGERMMFKSFSEEEARRAESNIYRHISRDFNIRGQLGFGNGLEEMPKDLRNAIFYQTIFSSGIWNQCDLTNVSGNGTVFRYNDFEGSLLNNVSMQYCSFTKDVFLKCSFLGSNFANSTFTYCAIQNSKIYGCSFLGAEFYSGILRNTEITSSNFELCRFRNIILEKLDLRELTLNYAFFENVSMKDVCLPFLQVPYTFNGLQYVFDTSDDIRLSSHDSSVKEIGLSEYKDMIEDFVIFFQQKNQYFPLTNCFIVQGALEQAVMCNETGIKRSSVLHDFHSLYFYCVQAAQILKLSRQRRGMLYAEINAILSNDTLTEGEYHQFYIYFPQIKRLLFDIPNDNPVMTLTIHTNIDPADYEKLAILLSALETATQECGLSLDSKHIEIRHNSPDVIDFFSSGSFHDLIANLQAIYFVLRPAIADVASIITLGGAVGAAGKLIWNKAAHPGEVSRKKAYPPEIRKLRKELDNLLVNNQGSYEALPEFRTDVESLFLERLVEVKRRLKESGVMVTNLEIQFLDGKEDVLDILYHQNADIPI